MPFATLASFGGLGSINAMAAIAYDRFVMICSSSSTELIAKTSRSVRICTSVWIISAIFPILPMFGVGGYMLDGTQTSCSFDYISRDWFTRAHLIGMYMFGFFLPLGVCIFCYARILIFVRSRQRKGSGESVRVSLTSSSSTPQNPEDS